MKRCDVRGALWAFGGKDGYTLPELCIDLRMALTGSADPWRKERVLAAAKILQDALDTWVNHHRDYEQVLFDETIRMLILATLNLVPQRALP